MSTKHTRSGIAARSRLLLRIARGCALSTIAVGSIWAVLDGCGYDFDAPFSQPRPGGAVDASADAAVDGGGGAAASAGSGGVAGTGGFGGEGGSGGAVDAGGQGGTGTGGVGGAGGGSGGSGGSGGTGGSAGSGGSGGSSGSAGSSGDGGAGTGGTGGAPEAGVCTPGTTQCHGNSMQVCDPTGQWGPGIPCSDSICDGGVCI